MAFLVVESGTLGGLMNHLGEDKLLRVQEALMSVYADPETQPSTGDPFVGTD